MSGTVNSTATHLPTNVFAHRARMAAMNCSRWCIYDYDIHDYDTEA